jgi:DNA-binding IclR family transcriptional regulator
MLQTIRKIGPVLDLFTVDHADWGVAEVAEAIDIPRSSAHALLASLAETGLLQKRGHGRYRIGWRVVELGDTLRGTADLRGHARPVMQELVGMLGETAQLAVLDRDRAVYIDKVSGRHHMNVLGARVGAQVDAHCCAVGKVLLAHQDPSVLARRLSTSALAAFTSNTITCPDRLTAELHKVRIEGCAFDAGEAVPEVHCVAAPIRDDLGSVLAALSITAPASRFLPVGPSLKRAVVNAATAVSERIKQAGLPRRQAARSGGAR